MKVWSNLVTTKPNDQCYKQVNLLPESGNHELIIPIPTTHMNIDAVQYVVVY